MYKGAMAFEYFGKTFTYGEMFHGIQQAEAGFRNAGVQAGDIVSAIAISVPEIIYTFYALNKIGAISNWIDPRKGAVMLSNENANSIVVQYQICGAPMARSHTWLSVTFPFTAYALICNLHLPLSLGMKCLLCFELNISKIERLLLKKRCNHMANTPIMWETIISSKKSQNKDYSFLITPTVGADTISVEGERRVNEFLRAHGSKYKLAKGYGMTEVASGVTFTPTNEVNKLGSVGIPFSHMTVGIFDLDSGEELPCGKQGEICIAGPSVMLGYYQNEKATAEVLKYHSDGRLWMHSGDLGHMDEDGFLFIDGRLKRMLINYVGFKIFAPDVEAVISQAEGIEKCCVVGVRDKEHKVGQVAVAFVKAEGEQNSMRERIYGVCQALLPEYSWPKEIYFVRELPYTAAGKVDIQALQAMAVDR